MKINEKHNKLIFTGNKINKNRRWLSEFKCDCGNICYHRPDRVLNDTVKSCGCKSYTKGYKEKQKFYGEDYAYYILHNRSHKNARSKNLVFNIAYQDIKEQFQKQNGKCFYTGYKFSLPYNYTCLDKNPTIPSVDRIDSNIGYLKNNIQLVQKDINSMKLSFSHEYFIELAHLVNNYRFQDSYYNLDGSLDYGFTVIERAFRKRTKHSKKEFNITHEHIKLQYIKQNGKCFYTGQLLKVPKNFLFIRDIDILSIDRINSSIGYTPDNIQLVTKQINFMKYTLSHNNFIETCKNIANTHPIS